MSGFFKWFTIGFPLVVFVLLGKEMLLRDEALSKRLRSLDFDGGVRLEYKMRPSSGTSVLPNTFQERREALAQSKRAFYFRLRNFDLAENQVKSVGNETIVVEVPNDKGIEDALSRTGILTFREVLDGPYEESVTTPVNQDSLYRYRMVVSREVKTLVYRLGPPLLGAEDIDYYKTRAQTLTPTPDSPIERNSVLLYVKQSSKPKLRAMTTKLYQKDVAICVDNDVYSVATVKEKNLESAAITGDFSRQRVKFLANILSGGYLASSFDLTRRSEIGPLLGADLKSRAFKMIVATLLLAFIFLVLRYINHMSLVAIGFISISLLFGVFSLLTLKGSFIFSGSTVCAFVVLLGMSLDNLILVFEDFTHKLGRNTRGVELGTRDLVGSFKKEFKIIVCSNLTTLVAIGLLYYAQGPVSDLVKAMGLGLIAAFACTVLFVRGLYGSESFVGFCDGWSPCAESLLPVTVNVFQNGIRGTLAVLYLATFLMATVHLIEHGVAWGIDLKGGTEVVIEVDQRVKADDVSRVMQAYWGTRPDVCWLDNGADEDGKQQYIVRIAGLSSSLAVIHGDAVENQRSKSDEQVKTSERMLLFLHQIPNFENTELVREDSVGPIELAGNEMAVKCLVPLSILLLWLCLWFCFDGWIATVAVLVLFTDAVIAIGSLSVFHIPLTMPMVACLLTLVGYSVNDSILLCGHMEECFESKAELRDDVVSTGLKPFSSRVLLTSLTTLFASGTLWYFGTATVRDFGLVLSIGVFFGMLSSITIVCYLVEQRKRATWKRYLVPQRSSESESQYLD